MSLHAIPIFLRAINYFPHTLTTFIFCYHFLSFLPSFFISHFIIFFLSSYCYFFSHTSFVPFNFPSFLITYFIIYFLPSFQLVVVPPPVPLGVKLKAFWTLYQEIFMTNVLLSLDATGMLRWYLIITSKLDITILKCHKDEMRRNH